MKTTKSILRIVMSAAVLLTGCNNENDNEPCPQQEENVVWQQMINDNIASLQRVVTVWQHGDRVTGVIPFESLLAPSGYLITFLKSGETIIWNGGNGNSPEIGIAQDGGDEYYWTLDGEWLLIDGSKIRTMNVAPKVAIGSDGNWYISADGSATGTPPTGSGWTNTNVKATDGAAGSQGNYIFAANGVDDSNPNYVVFTLANGTTTITIEKVMPSTVILGSYDTLQELIAAHPIGNPGDAYLAGGVLYIWDGSTNSWKEMGKVV